MPAVAMTFQLLDGTWVQAHADEVAALRAEVCGADEAFAGRLRTWRRQPGFAAAAAMHGGYLVGYACGMPLRPSTDWWRGLTTPLPEPVTAERPGRTFAVTGLVVRAAWRRQGTGRELHDLLLDGRTEERATVTVPPDARPAQQAFRSWNWRKAARTLGPQAQLLDILLRDLAQP